MNTVEYQTVQDCISSLPNLIKITEMEHNLLKNVFKMIMPTFVLPEFEKFNSSKGSTLSAMEVLIYLKSNSVHIDNFPVLYKFCDNIGTKDTDRFYLLYGVITKEWYVACMKAGTNVFTNYYQLDTSDFHPELYIRKMPHNKEKMMNIIGEIPPANFNDFKIRFYPSDIPIKNRLVHILNAPQNKEIYGVVDKVRFDNDKNTFILTFMYSYVLRNNLELVGNEYEVQEDDYFVCNVAGDYMPEAIKERLSRLGFIIEDGMYNGIKPITTEEFDGKLIAVPDSEGRGVIVGKCSYGEGTTIITPAILIRFGHDTRIEILSFPVVVNGPTIYWKPTQFQEEQYMHFCNPGNIAPAPAPEPIQKTSAAGTISSVIDDSPERYSYVTIDNNGTFRVYAIKDDIVTLTNFIQYTALHRKKFKEIARPASPTEIFKMLGNAFATISKVVLPNNIKTNYDPKADILYIDIHMINNEYLRVPVYEDGEWYAKNLKQDERIIIQPMQKTRVFNKDDKWVIYRDGMTFRVENGALIFAGYSRNELHDYTEYISDMVLRFATKPEKFDMSKLYCYADDTGKLNILLPETETTAYCIISTTKSRHVNINELNEIFEFLGHKKELHEL